ncbi:MAG: hypothetical protein LBT49_03955 [Prevotellaceae bacterium]|jgi:hypothetical protein|nr:hypothetical protein [Prevotellaceae bacterium]
MKTWVKIVSAMMLTGCLSYNLYAQEKENMYYVKFTKNDLQIGTSNWLCGDDYHSLEFYVKVPNTDDKPIFYGGYKKSPDDFSSDASFGPFSGMPASIRLLGKAGDEDTDNNPADETWYYTKGDSPRNLAVETSQRRGTCTRSLYANYTAIVDDPVEMSCNPSRNGTYTFSTETEKLTLRIGKFYENGKQPVLQISFDEQDTWKDIQTVRPNETVNLSYRNIVEKLGKNFESLLGKPLYFRILKTLLNGTKTYGNRTDAIVFYPDGIKFSITSTKRTYCEKDVKLTAHLENQADAEYMTLNKENYKWVMARDSADLTIAFYCDMTPLGENEFQIVPDTSNYTGDSRESPFVAEEDVFWYLQLQDRANRSQFYCVRKFTIPAKPKEITVEQMGPGYTINGEKYHVPHSNSKFAMLHISDPSYESHHRVPYYVKIDNEHEIPIGELGAGAFEDLTQEEQEKLRNEFEAEYAEARKNTTARKNFAEMQWGEVLPGKAERIAMPKDGSFFLYTKKSGSKYLLYKATFTLGIKIETTPLIPSENVIEFEVTPDGTYCIYKRYNTPGLYMLPLTGTIPSSGTLLSGKSDATAVSGSGEEFPSHIYKNSAGKWEYVSVYDGKMYSISIPDKKETTIGTKNWDNASLPFFYTSEYSISIPDESGTTATSVSDPIHVLEQGVVFYEVPLSSDNSIYRVVKIDILRKTTSTFYGYSDNGIKCHNTKPDGSFMQYPECTTYRLNRERAFITVAPDGESVIILENNKTYHKTPSSSGFGSIPSGSNFKINPNDTDVVFSYNGHTYKNSTASEDLIIGRTSSNICFSSNGKYFLFVNPENSYVYKQYMSENDALEDTEPLFKENAWNQFLNKRLGTKVGSKHILLNTAQTWTLRDADGCTYTPFGVHIKAPGIPSMSYYISKKPSSICAHDGTAVITYAGGGAAPFLYQSSTLQKQGDKITVSGLGYGNNLIQFTDEFGNESHLLTITIDGGGKISDVAVTHHTCATPNGKVRVSVTGVSGEKTYLLKNTINPFGTYQEITTNNSHEFTGIPSGMYKVSVSQGGCHFENAEEYEVESRIFEITNIAVAPSTTLEGNGSATVTFANLSGTAEWTKGDHLFDLPQINQTTVTTRSGGITPGTYALSARNSTAGCTIETSMTIDKPACSGKINLNYTKDSLRILTGHLTGNALFDPYNFRIIKSTGELITESKTPDVVIRQPGTYALYVRHTQAIDSLLLHEFTFPADPINANVDIAPPACPQSTGTVTINLQSGGFGNPAAVTTSVDGLNYTKPGKLYLDAAVYDAYLRDTAVKQTQYLNIHATLLQSLPLVVPAAEPVSAWVTHTSPSCVNSADGKIQLSDFTGGSGEYEYKINDNAWQDTTVAIDGLGPGTYNVYLRDKKYRCEAQHLYSVRLQAPDTLKVNIITVKHPTCELDNGSLTATVQGGDGYYRYDWHHDDKLLSAATYGIPFEISSGATLPAGFHKLQIYDGNNCTASDTITLRTYHNPQVETIRVEPVSCTGAKDGMVELLTASGTTPVDSVVLQHLYWPYTYGNTRGVFNQLDTGKYTLTLRDTLGCYTTTPYPLYVDEPETLRIAVDTIFPVIEKGSHNGKIKFGIYGGNAGHKTVLLKQEDGTVIDSLAYVNNVAPLSFTQLYAGLYSIEVADSKGCRAITGMLRIEEPADSLKFVIKAANDARCKSQAGSITVEGVGGWGGYRYKHGQEANFTALNTFDNLYPGRYVITVTDKLGAAYSETIMIHEPKDSLKAEITERRLPTCGNNGAFSIQLSGGTPPYKLYENTDTTFCAQPQTVVWTGKSSGNYLLHLADDNGCRFELEENLPGTALLAIERMEVTPPVLPAAPDGEIKVTVHGGTAPYTYQWTQDAATIPAGNHPELAGIPAGHYGVSVTDAEGCTVHEEVMLTDPSYVSFTVLESGHETAFEAADGYAVLLADMPLSDYTLITPDNTKVTYAGNAVTDTFHVQNDTVYLRGLRGGKWVMVGANAAGHHAVSEILINPYHEFLINNITVSPVREKGASGGQARIDVQGGGGGNRYSWTTSGGIPVASVDYEYSSILSNVPAGAYTVTVKDCYNNILQKEIVIEEPEQALTLRIAGYQNQSCKTSQDAYVVLSAEGGWGDYQFRRHPEPYFGNGATYRNMETAGHYFYVIDRQGVVDSTFIEVTEPEYVRTSGATITSVRCKNASDGTILFTVTGGTAPYFLSAPDDETWTPGNTANGLHAGYHTFVFKDKNNCAGQDTVTLYMPEPDSLLFETVAVTHTTCAESNGKVKVGMQGGTPPYQYRWANSGNIVVGDEAEISGLTQNEIYQLRVTDSNGCTQQLEQHIQPSTGPAVTEVRTTPALCYGDTTGTASAIVVPATPYAPYALAWSNGDQGTFSNRFYEGTHRVMISDTNGCTDTSYFEITQPDSLHLFATEIKTPHCYGYSDGHILTGTLGGVKDYTYRWSDGATTPDAENLAKGNYSVVVTDANGCVYQKSFTLEEPDAQTVDLGEQVIICSGNTYVMDGKDYAAHRWYTAEGDISGERYLSVHDAGHYLLEAIDARGCPAFGEVTVDVRDNALEADFLLASEAALGDTLILFELSNLALDSLSWEYDPAAFEHLTWDNDYDYSYVLSLRNLRAGLHDIGLRAYSGGCYSYAVKSVDIATQPAPAAMQKMPYHREPLISEVTLYPNPNNAVFTVEVILREMADVRLALFSVVPGALVHERTERGSDYYQVKYNLSKLTAGMYIMMVTAGNERRLVNLIIAE